MRKVWTLEDIIGVAERFVLEAVLKLEEHQGDEDSTKLKKRVLNKGMDELLYLRRTWLGEFDVKAGRVSKRRFHSQLDATLSPKRLSRDFRLRRTMLR